MSVWIGLGVAALAIAQAFRADEDDRRLDRMLRNPEKAAAYKHVCELFSLRDYNK